MLTPKPPDARPIPIMWLCPHCRNVAGNFSHRNTCAACGEPRPNAASL
jgi:hypothetical protein